MKAVNGLKFIRFLWFVRLIISYIRFIISYILSDHFDLLNIGTIDEIILEGRLQAIDHPGTSIGVSYKKDEEFINGLTDFKLCLKENIQIYESEMIESSGLADDGYNEIDFINFPPGSVVVLRCVIFFFCTYL